VHQRDALVLLVRQFTDELGLTTVLVTHDRDEALALATDVVVLHGGRLVEAGPALQLLQAPATAFTAAFLAGAACLPTTADSDGRVATPFGTFARPNAHGGDLRLVLLPGDATATAAAPSANGPTARVLTTMPTPTGFVLRVALGDQIVTAHAAAALPAGAAVQLALRHAPRLLPWDSGPGSTHPEPIA
jgi:ABC-type sulfate/molybdate transport systems ATPase subunit